MDKISTIFLGISLVIVMLGMGLSLTLNDFKRIFVKPKAVLLGLANQIFILPIVGFILASLFSLKPEIAIGIMILAACPGGTTSNLICHLAKGDTALSVSLTAISSLITIVTIPFIINFSLEYFLEQGQIIELPVVKTIVQILGVTIIPVTIGMVIKKYNNAYAEKMEKPVRKASAIVMLIIILGVCFKEKNNLIESFKAAGLVAITLNLLTLFIGYYSAKLLKLSKKSAISIAIESGVQNGTLAITIAILILENNTYAVAPAIYSLLMFFTGGIVVYLGTRKKA